VLALGFAGPLKAVNDKGIKDAEEKAKSAVGAYASQESKFKGKLDESEKEQARVKSIIAGQEERLNWPRFFEVYSAALPNPGEKEQGGNLIDDPVQVRLRNGNGGEGLAALAWFKHRLAAGVPLEKALEDERSNNPKYLAMVNVEAVHTRWVDSVAKFLE